MNNSFKKYGKKRYDDCYCYPASPFSSASYVSGSYKMGLHEDYPIPVITFGERSSVKTYESNMEIVSAQVVYEDGTVIDII